MTDSEDPRVRIVSPPESVPVYTCVVHIRRSDDCVEGVIANLPNTVLTAATERDVLQKAVNEFKAILKTHHGDGTDMPFVEPPTVEDGVSVRYVPVHL